MRRDFGPRSRYQLNTWSLRVMGSLYGSSAQLQGLLAQVGVHYIFSTKTLA